MKIISDTEIITKIKLENPWWGDGASVSNFYRDMHPRAYLDGIFQLIKEQRVNRALVLMGPRRVGKTVLLHHAVQKLIGEGIDPRKICYVSIDAPIYTGCSLEHLIELYRKVFAGQSLDGTYIYFDEIQYLKNWEIHLKKLVDDYKNVKFVVSGSAAAALRLKSIESGAGRFTNFYLPPLTFYEYLQLLGKQSLVTSEPSESPLGRRPFSTSSDIVELNKEFVNYLNYGGYPEALFSEAIKGDQQRYIKSDIIDKVLLKDIPGLYGIHDIQELNRLFTMLALNSGFELSLDKLSVGSGVAKNTIKRYLEYLEAAFLIAILHRIDQSGKQFKRANFFKVYLTNPSMRCALFGPITADDESMGHMTETAIISQWLHSQGFENLYYARWRGGDGEVDLVFMHEQKPGWCGEIKWSNRFFEKTFELNNLTTFAKKHSLTEAFVTTVDKRGERVADGIRLEFIEASIYSHDVGRNTINRRTLFRKAITPNV